MDVSVIIPHPANFDGFLDFYSLRCKGVRVSPHAAATRRGELYISATGRLCSHHRHVELESMQLAEAFREFLLPAYLKRNGKSADIIVVPCTTISPDQSDYHRLKLHSCLVRNVLGITG